MALIYDQYLNYSGGIYVETAAPLDIRTVVQNISELTTKSTWYTNYDVSTGTLTAYNGLIVYVEAEKCAYVCVNLKKVDSLTEGWKKIGSDVELSGAAVIIVQDKDTKKYYESTDTAHENEITDGAVTANGAGHYLKLTIAQGDVIYIPTSNLVDLSNYYTKTEIDTKIAGINQFKYEVAAELPEASESTLYILYLIPAQVDSSTNLQNIYDQYITVQQTEGEVTTYTWEKIGDTRVDFSDINSRLDNIDSSITNINSSISNINSSIVNINSSINTINTSIGNISSSITTINTSIGNISSSVNEIYELAKGAITDISAGSTTSLATLVESASNNTSDITLSLSVSDGSIAGTGLATNTYVNEYVDKQFEWVSVDGGQFSW